MKIYEVLEILQLDEGVHDKGIFKAIFLSGGPGSGKSFFTERAIKGNGFRVINPDKALEAIAKKKKLSLKNLNNPEVAEIQKHVKKVILNKQQDIAINGRLPIVIDRTGTNINLVSDLNTKLKSLGYETSMVFIDTDKEVANKRNQDRPRTVEKVIMDKSHDQVRKNQDTFKKMFGSRYFSVNNTPPFDAAKKKEFDKMWVNIMKWKNAPVTNPKSLEWVKCQKDKCRRKKGERPEPSS